MSRRFLVLLGALLFTGAVPFPVDPNVRDNPGIWPQFDGRRIPRSVINDQNVSRLQIMWQVPLPEATDGSPVFVGSVDTSKGIRDLLIVTTVAGRVVAIDANSGAPVWTTAPPDGPRWTTSSPAIDPTHEFVFGYSLDGYVHRYDIGTGREVPGPGWPALITLKGDVEKGSSSINIATAKNGRSYLYMTIAAYPEPGDDGDYQGHLVTVDLKSGEQHVFNALCSDRDAHFTDRGDATDCSVVQGGIWARAGAVYDSQTDRVFVTTGNGPFNAQDGGYHWGTSVIALRPDGTTAGGTPLDSYTPENYQDLTDQDLDLSSTTIEPLATSNKNWPRLGVQGGKDGKLRLLNLEDLSGAGEPRHIGGELQVVDIPQGGMMLSHPTSWLDGRRSWLFVANDRGIAAFELVANEDGDPELVLRWQRDLSGTTPIVVNRVLYLASAHRFTAIRPTSGATLWQDNSIGDIHWQNPIIVNDTVYVPDSAGYITAYALSTSL
jgi:outer membrane protein assembly factor BamB